MRCASGPSEPAGFRRAGPAHRVAASLPSYASDRRQPFASQPSASLHPRCDDPPVKRSRHRHTPAILTADARIETILSAGSHHDWAVRKATALQAPKEQSAPEQAGRPIFEGEPDYGRNSADSQFFQSIQYQPGAPSAFQAIGREDSRRPWPKLQLTILELHCIPMKSLVCACA